MKMSNRFVRILLYVFNKLPKYDMLIKLDYNDDSTLPVKCRCNSKYM